MTDRHTLRADRRRADACVKACEGISTEALEAGVIKRAIEALRYMATQPSAGWSAHGEECHIIARNVSRELDR